MINFHNLLDLVLKKHFRKKTVKFQCEQQNYNSK